MTARATTALGSQGGTKLAERSVQVSSAGACAAQHTSPLLQMSTHCCEGINSTRKSQRLLFSTHCFRIINERIRFIIAVAHINQILNAIFPALLSTLKQKRLMKEKY